MAASGGGDLPSWYLQDLVKQPRSLSHRSIELKVFTSDEILTVPVTTSTTVQDIKDFIGKKLNVPAHSIDILVKQGCAWRTQFAHEEVGRKAIIKGIKSFTRERREWPDPIAIIGTGHAGLRQAMYFIKKKEFNFVVYDRRDKVGGTSWWDQANTTSKLQTELGTYHLQYDEDNPVPKNMKTWPTRDELLEHFIEVAAEYGVMPYTKMCTNVKEVTILAGSRKEQEFEMMMTKRTYATQTLRFTLEPTDGSGDGRGDRIGATGVPCYDVNHAAVIMYPGNLTIPRRSEYKGEDEFNRPIAYAICNDFDYANVVGKAVAIIGHGAFAVENLRTCLEYSSSTVYIICRRKNLSCPRVVSWLANQSLNAISAKLFLVAMEPAYSLIGFDPWSYYAVHTNERRTNVNLIQKARFGIGDLYFIAIAMGMCEVIEDDVKRLSEGTVHLINGRRLDVGVLLKLYGFNGNFDVDRLLRISTMHGFWVDNDFRRFIIAEPIGVNASNFAGTSFSPGARMWVELPAHFLWFPDDWVLVSSSGMLPTHSAEPENDRPAYVIDARHGTTTGMILPGMIQVLGESSAVYGPYKRKKQLECHPMQKFVQECADEWMEYGKKFQALGAKKPIPPFPYTPAIVQRFLDMENEELAEMMKRAGAG